MLTKWMGVISLRTKLVLFVLVVILVTAGSITLFSYKATETAILNQAQSYSEAYLNQVNKRFEIFMENIHRGVMSIAYNKDLVKTISKPGMMDYEDMKALQRNMDMLTTYSNANRYIQSMTLYDLSNGIRITSAKVREAIDRNSPEFQILDSLYGKNGERPIFKWLETRKISEMNATRDVISFVMPVNFLDDAQIKAVVVANIREEEVGRLFIKSGLESGRIVLVGAGSRIVSSGNKSEIGKTLEGITIPQADGMMTSGRILFQGEESLVTCVKSGYIGWTFVSMTPVHELMKSNVDVLKTTFLIICVLTIAIVFIISLLLYLQIYKPIGSLIQEIRQDDGNGALHAFYGKRKDEIGFLYNSFHEVLDEKKVLLENVYDQKLLLKDAEIRLLHAQINSHFLYNTLDSVIWMAKAKNYEKIILMVGAMVRFFRISLDRGNEIISVKRVIEQIESYFDIQKIRYADRLNVVVDIETEILGVLMLKLLLQPIVENAVQHGIEKKIGNGTILVSGKKEGNFLHFVVEDNGIGIPFEKLEEVNRIINDEEQNVQDFYALQNINRRIRLFYGPQYGLRIESHLGEGTKVGFLIPILEAGRDLPC